MLKRRTARLLKTFIAFFIVSLLWIQLHLSPTGGNDHGKPSEPFQSNDGGSDEEGPARSMDLHADQNDSDVTKINITETKMKIKLYNDIQVVLNEDLYGPVQKDTLVIVVQIHNRKKYLHELVRSLSKAKGIDSVLLIFSHDYYDEDMNDIVQAITFCRVMQIFYPFSIQTHPNEFPGDSPNDCPRNTKPKDAKKKGCINAEWPDLYNHYREARFTQIKHHWWWKANHVFGSLHVTRNHTGLVLFLEEDHLLSEDFIHILRLMDKRRQEDYPTCTVLCLGTYTKMFTYSKDGDKAELVAWQSSRHNMGMAFNMSVWKDVTACANEFCNRDDYNWDWSLQYINEHCMKRKLTVMVMKTPRVFHIGECGVHRKNKICDVAPVRRKVEYLLRNARSYLFPANLKIYKAPNKKLKKLKANGGWGDKRDHELCLNTTVR